MRILIVNQYFPPDAASTAQLLGELAADLSLHHEVTVVCGRPSYQPTEQGSHRGLTHEERAGRVRVLRTWSTAYDRARIAGRLTNYATYLASSLTGIVKAERPDVILTMTDPPFVAAAAMAAGAIRRVPFVYVNQDVFPEVGLALGVLREGTTTEALRRLNRTLRSRAGAVVAIGRDMRARLEALGAPAERLHVIPNWSDSRVVRPLEGDSALRGAQGWDERFVVMHSGNVGLSQDLDVLVEAVALLRDPSIVVAIVGEGPSKQRLRAKAEALGLGPDRLAFVPAQPKDSLADSLGAADLHLVMLQRGLAGVIVPSKVYGVMAAGKPYLAAIEPGTEPDLLAQEHGCGLRIDPGDPEALSEAIRRAREKDLAGIGARGRAAFEERFDRPIAVAAYDDLLQRTADLGRKR
jgi:glycosyltransferase involved in cell wall biosynthesis